jgi:pyruvate dehydrogenase E2 component (dihydrolipoamide acetyltransferase)
MRKAIATNLQQSKQTVPHFYVRVSVDAGRLLAYAKSRKADAACSVNDVVVAGLGRAIHEFPALRSRLEGDSIVEYPTVNIGIAVGLDDGLVVPVVMQVERLTLAQLAAETKRVVDNARKGKLENLGKAVFSVSNLGMFGVEEFSAIINPPEAGILAVSAAREAVIVKDGALKPGRLMTMTLSADHRVVDGLVAAKFVARLKEILEAPEQIA